VVRVSGLKMTGIDEQKIIRKIVNLEKCLILDDDLLELSLQRKIFSQRMLNDLMRNESPSVDYYRNFYIMAHMHLLNLLIY